MKDLVLAFVFVALILLRITFFPVFVLQSTVILIAPLLPSNDGISCKNFAIFDRLCLNHFNLFQYLRNITLKTEFKQIQIRK